MALHISIDVDQTILDDEGCLIAGVREALVNLRAHGDYRLQLWSMGGAEYAREKAEQFQLTDFFDSYATKPDVAIDDRPEDAAPMCRLGVPFADAARAIDGFVAAAVDTALQPSQEVIELVADIQAEQGEIEQAYRGKILRDGLPLHPVPFFGNLDGAAIITIGLNPSSTEFEPWRLWPREAMAADELARRLAGYFRSVAPRPHAWFGDYQEALAIIGGEYKINAAHLDLLPWPTLSPTYLSQMVEPRRKNLLQEYNSALIRGRDDWLAFSLKCAIPKVKLILIFDPFENRAAATKAICREALPEDWSGRIECFKETYDCKEWCWKNRHPLQQLLGTSVFIG